MTQRTTIHLFGCILAVTSTFYASAIAQNAQPGIPPAGVAMANEPLRLDQVGLILEVPAESIINTVQIEGQQVKKITAGSWPWYIEIRTPQSSNPQTTTMEAADTIINKLLGSVGIRDASGNVISSRGKLKTRISDLEIGGEVADRFYLQMPSKDPKTNIIQGYTIFRPKPGQFVIISLITNEKDLPKARLIYETVVGSAVWTDAAAATSRRAAPIQTGIHVLQSLTPDDFQTAMEAVNDTWYRLYLPGIKGAAAPDKEQGYKRMRARRGSRGELDPKNPRNKWTQSDHEEGYILQIDSRTLYGESWIDSQAIFFMSLDRVHEAWIVKNKVQEGKRNNVITEIGARTNQDLSIQRKLDGKLTASGQLQTPETGYASQVEWYLLPQLLLVKKLPGEYGFYTYRMQDQPTVRYRSDLLEQPPQGGHWKLTSTVEESEPPRIAFFSEDGRQIRADHLKDDLRSEPIPYDTLLYLWKSKGLPTK